MISRPARTLSRRRFAGTMMAGAMASSIYSASAIVAARQSGEASGELTEWGFGVQETNPLARG